MTLLFFLRVALSRELRMREKLPQYNTIDDAANLIKGAQRIMILTGAGISTSVFRTRLEEPSLICIRQASAAGFRTFGHRRASTLI